MTEQSVRIWIIDHQPIVRAGLKRMIEQMMPLAIVVDFGQLGQVMQHESIGGAPDLIISDLKLPDAYGISALREIKNQYRDALIVIFSSIDGGHYSELCLEFGATDYFEKTISIEGLYSKIADFSRLLGQDESSQMVPVKLSRRQKELLPLLVRGKSNREISEELLISEHTVKVHLTRLYQRLNVKSRLEAVYKFGNYLY
jgi:DNA-binding NarL/FixJ family response regulator